VALTVRRGATELQVAAPLVTGRPLLVPELNGIYPAYFIYGPIPFSTVTADLVSALAKNVTAMDTLTRAGSPLVTKRAEFPNKELEELVMIAGPFFPHRLANGYGAAAGAVVESVNDIPVRSLKHLVQLLRDLKDDYVIFKIAQHRGEMLVFPRRDMIAATEEILRSNDIREQGTPELMAIWRNPQGTR
jgi:hypothetical protein